MLPAHLTELLDARAYPHRCDAIELIETHISWVLKTGTYVYKIKRPVDLGFVDFSTLARRRHFCSEELRLNRRFAPSLYVDVVGIVRGAGGIRVGGEGEPFEYAVRMRQFDADWQLDRRLAAGVLGVEELGEFGATLAGQHADLPRCEPTTAFGTAAAVYAPVVENFKQIAASRLSAVQSSECATIAAWSERRHGELNAWFDARRAGGHVRECHGDLHLSNLVALPDGIHAFDCIEFSDPLRWIDVISDVAFLVMDCAVRERGDLGYAFLSRYLETSGDYLGCRLLDFYLVYRSMVRAKVAALSAQEGADVDCQRRFEQHVGYALARVRRGRGALVLMCGLSGSGKSWLAQRLVTRLPALRIRSDVERKRLAGLDVLARSDSPIDAGLYRRNMSDAVYARLADCAEAVVAGGELAIVDATFLDATRRQTFRELAARLGVGCLTVHCDAPPEILESRVANRDSTGDDASEATIEVLAAQRRTFLPPHADEGALLTVATNASVDVDAVAAAILDRFSDMRA
jgi:aminoglycoside phosphotransferase family enzyme/predicted kinase